MAAPALVAGVMWCLVAGWWAGTNFSRFGHPFPHVWALEDPAANVILSEPAPYRRPLGWALPIEWQQYWRFPLLRTPQNPRPNFWAVEVTGTWSDIYNRGFCRLKGSGDTSYVWGARNGFMSQHSDAWDVSHRCVHWFAAMLHVGVWLTAASVLSVLWCLWQSLKTWGARGTLVFSLMPLVGTASGLWLALAYPYDNIAALNPRYLLSQVMPMSVCLGLGLAQVEAFGGRNGWRGAVARWASWLALGLVALIGLMLVYERFGW